MHLSELLSQLHEYRISGKPGDIVIRGIAYDPLRVQPGFLYVPIRIYTRLDKIELPDGHPFINDAIARGAVAVVQQQETALPAHIPCITVPDSRLALAQLANHFYHHPGARIKLLGITGTNGKTTTTHIAESIFSQQHRFGLTGTLYCKIAGHIHPSKDTTPEPVDLQEILGRMVAQRCDYCMMEVSSHGIDFHRVAGLTFAAGVFSNLTPDHLDYHKTMDHYRATKMRFFRELPADSFAILNRDDPNYEAFREATGARLLTYGRAPGADVYAADIRYSLHDTRFTLCTPAGNRAIISSLIGKFNLYNTLAAAATALSQDIPLDIVQSGLQRPIRVPGRFERIHHGQPFSVVVDYAHTADSMDNVLGLARSLSATRIITVFGCGGDRDPGKRPDMGRIADTCSDVLVVTSDNPRNEDPRRIIDDILAGISSTKVTAIVDRAAAIAHALTIAQKGDMVLILGKGHETTQTIKGETITFNDREVAEGVLRSLGYAPTSAAE